MKLMKTLMAFGTAMTMVVSMSAVSYAQFPLSMMIASAAPISMDENDYQLCLSEAVVKHNQQTAQALSVPQQETVSLDETVFYPGDILYIPIVDTVSGQLYEQKTRPSNWDFKVTGFDPQVVETVRWANENGTLNIAVDFAKNLPKSEKVWTSGTITLYDEVNGVQALPIHLNLSFSNVTKEVIPYSVNEIISPMNLYAGKRYSGEPVTLSFGGNVTLKGAVLSQGETLYLNLDQSFDNEIANRYRSFDIQCYHFLGEEDSFSQPAKLCLPAQRTDSFVYEVVNGELRSVQSEYDPETNQVCFTVASLGYYIVSPILMQE